jgi:hypothetical protein
MEKILSLSRRRAKSPRLGAPVITRRTERLLTERMELHTLLDTMEHDKSFDAAPWQVRSVKDELKEIEERILRSRRQSWGHRYGHR